MAACNYCGDVEMQSQHEHSASLPTQDDIERKPWKYIGYQSFAKFTSSDSDVFILRRFGSLNARVLLGLQDQLSQLEEELNFLENRLRSKDGPNIHNGSFRQETQDERAQLIRLAQQLLHNYNELVLQNSQLQARPEVPKRDLKSLRTWISNNQHAILDAETDYAKHTSDLFSLVPSSKTPLRNFLEYFNYFRLLDLWREEREDSTSPGNELVYYNSDKRIDRVLSTLIILVGLTMLIAPLWILAFVHDLKIRLSVICAFIVVFVILLSLTTVAKPFESLAAAAAYSAVLVVFLQLNSTA